jgi:hypothetical protein
VLGLCVLIAPVIVTVMLSHRAKQGPSEGDVRSTEVALGGERYSGDASPEAGKAKPS